MFLLRVTLLLHSTSALLKSASSFLPSSLPLLPPPPPPPPLWPTAAPTFQIAIFVTVSTGVEKAIIWASRFGNEVLVEVSQRQVAFLEIPVKAIGANDFQSEM